MSATHPSCSLALPDIRQRRVRRPHHHQRRSALAPGPLAERTRSHAHHDMWAPPLAFFPLLFCCTKDSKSQRTTRHHLYSFSRTNSSKYQQAYVQESIAVHTHVVYLMYACRTTCTVHLHALACKDMVIRHRPFACTVHANETLSFACRLGTVHHPVVLCSHALQ